MNNNNGQKNKVGGSSRSQLSNQNDLSIRDRAINSEKQRIAAIKKRRAQKAFLDRAIAIFVFSLLGLFLSLAIIFGYIFIDFQRHDKAPNFKIEISFEKDKKTTLDEADSFYSNGEYYVSLTKICELSPLTLHGDARNMTLSAGDEYASFDIGTNNVNICGTYCLLSAPSLFTGELYIPVSFFNNHCENVSVGYSSGIGTKKVSMDFSGNFGFKESIPEQITSLPVSSRFRSDLSEYEMYMDPENRDEYLVLINKENMLSPDYAPDDLVNIRNTRKDGRTTQKMRLYAAKSLEALFIEMEANGFTDVSVTSGYRDYNYQKTLFDRNVAAFGGNVALAQTEVAIPGSSEHQSGLCVDMHNLSSASQAFSRQAAYKWLYSNCADFGFILRYPEGKEEITEIIFEPWHYRYVGRYHAQKIMSEGLCLEEYMEKLGK